MVRISVHVLLIEVVKGTPVALLTLELRRERLRFFVFILLLLVWTQLGWLWPWQRVSRNENKVAIVWQNVELHHFLLGLVIWTREQD